MPQRSAPRRPVAPPRPIAGPPAASGEHDPGPAADAGPPRDPAQELRTLHEFLRLATTARTWNELLETVVDGTRDALHADVTSLYLLDRDGLNLRLAGTNGLDRHQIGRAIVPFGEGITGRVAAMRQAMVIADVADDARFLWVRGIDQRRFVHSMLSVPLTWRDQVVGVLNVQTETHRNFTDGDVAQLSAIADLLAGIVEKGRLQAEAEAQVEQLVALDRARSELIALVTHELRTPLAVVRAYTDLLAEEPPLVDRTSRDVKRRQTRAAWHTGTLDQIERLDRLVDSILTSVRVIPDQPAALETVDLAAMVGELVDELGAAARPSPHHARAVAAPPRPGGSRPPSTGAGAPARERGEVRAPGHARRDRLADRRGGRAHRHRGPRPGDPARVAGADLRAVRTPRDVDGAGVRHRALRGTAAGGIHEGTTVVRARRLGGCALRARAPRGGRGLAPIERQGQQQ